MHPDNESAPVPQTGRPPRRRGKGRHFRPSRRPRPSVAASTSSEQDAQTEEAIRPSLPDEDAPDMETVEEPLDRPAAVESTERAERAARPERVERERPERAEVSRAPAISRAIEHVHEVIDDLKTALEEMELALELLEEAERQKLDDEREIKALQKALERVNRFRGGRSSERSERGQD